MRRGDRITEIYAFICMDPIDDCEGIPAFSGPHPSGSGTVMMPMIGVDKERMRSLIPMARQMCRKTGKPMRLVRFTKMQEIEEITPKIDMEEEADRA